MIPEIPTQPMPDWISNASAPLPELCIREVLSGSVYYPGTEEAHTNPTRQRGECLRALAGASG